MCKLCDDLAARFPLNSKDHNRAGKDYFWAFQTLRERMMLGTLEYLAGNCPPEDIEKHIDKEDLYTMRHYFRCSCGKIFFIGYCCRGMPLGQIVDELPANLASIDNHST